MSKVRVDETDRRILRYLLKDARQSYAALGRTLGLSESAIRHRVNQLVKHQVIQRFTVALDFEKIGYPITVIIGVKIGGKSGLASADQLGGIDGVVDVNTVTGEFDLILRVICRDIRCFEQIVEKIRSHDFVEQTLSFVVINKIRENDYDHIIEVSPTVI